MYRFISFMCLTIIFCGPILGGCNQPQTSNSPASSAQASPTATVTPNAATAAAVKEAMSKAGAPVLPGASPGVTPSIPAVIPESMRRPLTLEEICNLVPDKRDLILKAQGRPNACDSLKKKK
jgi:hypothetical protein